MKSPSAPVDGAPQAAENADYQRSAGAASLACRWHPDARQIGPVEVIQRARYEGDPSAGKRSTVTFCLACEADAKPTTYPREF